MAMRKVAAIDGQGGISVIEEPVAAQSQARFK